MGKSNGIDGQGAQILMVLMGRVHTQQLALDWEEEVPAPAPLARQDHI